MVDPELEAELAGYPGDLVERFRSLVRELEADLNTDPGSIARLLREPVDDRAVGLRRYRIGKYRAFFIVVYEDCMVVFVDLEHRKKAYDRLRKRR